ncbi:unnamed protein product, partial [Amoebophrya sp. A25]
FYDVVGEKFFWCLKKLVVDQAPRQPARLIVGAQIRSLQLSARFLRYDQNMRMCMLFRVF